MISTSYYLSGTEQQHIIIHETSGVRVRVYGLECDDYQPAPGEIHIFGDDHGEWLAFETEGWNGENLEIITQAVVWYARYLDYPQMQILTEDPRPKPYLRVVSSKL